MSVLPAFFRGLSAYFTLGSNRAFAGAVALVAVLHTSLVVLGIYAAPVGFDEAYVLQAPWNLALGHGYATFDWASGTTLRTFDNLISTGPAVLLPIAATFMAFGVGILQVRWTMVAFYLLFVVVVWVLGRRIGGRWVGLCATIAILALNLRWDFPRTAVWGLADGLGELPAAAFILLAALLLPKSRAWAGTALGIAALCKLVALIAIPAFAVALLLLPVVGTGWAIWRGRLLAIVKFGMWSVVPSGLWELIKLASLGWAGYRHSLKAYIDFVLRSGSGLDAPGAPHDLAGRTEYLAGGWFLPAGAAVLVCLVLLAVASRSLADLRQTAQIGYPGAGRATIITVIAGLGSTGMFLVWWVAFANSVFARHAYPGLLLVAPVLAALGMAGVKLLFSDRSRGWRFTAIVITAAWVAIAGWQTTSHIAQAGTAPTYTRADQESVAKFLEQESPSGVQHIDYWQNPELRLLSGVNSTPFPHGAGPLVLSPQMHELYPELYEESLARCGEILYNKAGFIVCDLG